MRTTLANVMVILTATMIIMLNAAYIYAMFHVPQYIDVIFQGSVVVLAIAFVFCIPIIALIPLGGIHIPMWWMMGLGVILVLTSFAPHYLMWMVVSEYGPDLAQVNEAIKADLLYSPVQDTTWYYLFFLANTLWMTLTGIFHIFASPVTFLICMLFLTRRVARGSLHRRVLQAE